jgi:hypothetical protein
MSKPAFDDPEGLTDRNRDLAKTFTLSAKVLGLFHLRPETPFLFAEPARHRAVQCLISA